MPNGKAGETFDANFFRSILPDRVKAACTNKPKAVPVVQLCLSTGQILDLCHISHLADGWFSAFYYRDVQTCEDMDMAFVPYSLVMMVTLSLHAPAARRIGFLTEESKIPSAEGSVKTEART